MVQSKCGRSLESSHIRATRLALIGMTLCCCDFSSLPGCHGRCVPCLCPRVAHFPARTVWCQAGAYCQTTSLEPQGVTSHKVRGRMELDLGIPATLSSGVLGWRLRDQRRDDTESHLSSVRLPDTLHCANISIISEASCNKDYPGRVLPTMVCAGVEGGGTDSCEVRAKWGLWVKARGGGSGSGGRKYPSLLSCYHGKIL